MEPDDKGKAVAKEIKRLRKSGCMAGAIALGERDVAENGPSARVLCSLGSTYLQAGRYDEAEQRFKRTLEINPRDEVALTSLGQVALAQGNYGAAEQRFKRTLEINPRDEVALNSLGQVALAQGNYGAAEQRFKRTLEINPRNEVALNSLGQVALAQGNYGEAEQRFKRTLEINPRNEVALFLSARLAMQRGDFPRALGIVRAQLQQRPHVPTMRVARLMAEHGVGGKDWSDYYDCALKVGREAGFFTAQEARELSQVRNIEKQPESLSPEFFRELDAVIGEVARSKLFAVAEVYYPAPVNALASQVAGLHAEPKDSYRRGGGGNRKS